MTKYRAQRVQVDGHKFDSKAEAKRYGELKLLQMAGEISGLTLQPEFPVSINGRDVCAYRADFAYFTKDKRIIEDVKGFKTPIYRLKKKLVEAAYPGVEIMEIGA